MHVDAHSDPSHRNTDTTRVADLTLSASRNAALVTSHASEGEHEKRHQVAQLEANLADGAGLLEIVPIKMEGAYREQSCRSVSSEKIHVHRRSPRSATSNRSRTTRSILWQDLRDKHAEVLRQRISLREVRTSLGVKQDTIYDAEAQLLPAMTAALTEISTPTKKDAADGLQVLLTVRQSLRLDFEAHGKLEQQLISEEEELARLEFVAFAEESSPTEFPGGYLDFTRDDGLDKASIISVPADVPPEKQEYDRCLMEVTVIRERLLDMQSENEQLVREQAKRNRLGRTLDDFSLRILDGFEDRFLKLTSELDRAQADFEVAEMTWKSRRRAIEAADIDSGFAEPPASKESSRFPLDEFYNLHEDTLDDLNSLVEEEERAAAIGEILFQPETEQGPDYHLPSEAEDGEIINQARFISEWFLQRIHQSPAEARYFSKELAKTSLPGNAQELASISLSYWTQDGTEDVYITNVKKGVFSKAESHSWTSKAESHSRTSSGILESLGSDRADPVL